MAEGLTSSNELSLDVVNRALACLRRLGQRIRHLPAGNVRVVGTNTLRKAHDSEDFIAAAQRALGHEVEIVSGREEARLIYLGVSHSLEPVANDEARLVVDIGGGSTELILGHQFQARLMESLYMGCVSMSARHFGAGRITAEGFACAENAARQELEAVEQILPRARVGHGHWRFRHDPCRTRRHLRANRQARHHRRRTRGVERTPALGRASGRYRPRGGRRAESAGVSGRSGHRLGHRRRAGNRHHDGFRRSVARGVVARLARPRACRGHPRNHG